MSFFFYSEHQFSLNVSDNYILAKTLICNMSGTGNTVRKRGIVFKNVQDYVLCGIYFNFWIKNFFNVSTIQLLKVLFIVYIILFTFASFHRVTDL